MDDSEKSYGYSEDIYHGKKPQKSYEYGAENTGDAEGSDLSPEEEAIRVEGPRNEEPQPTQETREYDYGRDEEAVDSFTWGNAESEEPVGASRGEAAKPTR